MQILKGIGKVIAAGMLAIVILSCVLCFYSITPVHITNEKGNTDYVWPSNSIWIKMTEGTAWGKFDENGYNNEKVIENPDILILGSSHMEATNVMQDENTAYLLGKKLEGKYSVYNMGISGHNFFKVCQYLPASLKLYEKAPKVVIIETSTVEITRKKVKKLLNGAEQPEETNQSKWIEILQKIPFFRTLYHQKEEGLLKLFMPSSESTDPSVTEEKTTERPVKKKAYKELFSYLSKIKKESGTQIVIFYHPTGTLAEDGSILFEKSKQLLAFQQYAKKYDIHFVDMTSAFENMYEKEHHVAHGFITGRLEEGHLNAYGHAAIADSLYKEIIGLEENGILCK